MTFDGYDKLTPDELVAYDNRQYGSARIAKGLYVQLADDGELLFLISKGADGARMGLDPENFPEYFDYWTWTPTTRAELERFARAADTAEDFEVEVRQSVSAEGWYRTKRDATAAALSYGSRPTPAPKLPSVKQAARLAKIKEQGLGIGAVLTAKTEGE